MKKQHYNGSNKTFFVPEFDDVMNAKDLGTDHTVEDWPFGRSKRCSMHFFVETDPKRGERFVKQSTMNGRSYKPKKDTYHTKCKIVEIDGKIGNVVWHDGFNQFGVNIQDGHYSSQTFFNEDATALKNKFFG